ncbi:unnamed protein product [Triticum aestivum]|uniref:DUF4283 domain-containing protein n=2 Tax=Triticum TaxID=4564 RepID=A0A9R1Q9U2_TRITD|nr:unnamed protein product [Triticum aestivum]VAH73332.1 unnamed protein product [Triticum turgidum subsp. durum]
MWVQICGLLPNAKEEGVIRGMSRLLGKFVAVDGPFLAKGPAVQVQIKSLDPSKLKMMIQMFFNNVGYDHCISVEGGTPTDPLSLDVEGRADPEPGPGGGAAPRGSPRRSCSRLPHSEASDDDSTDAGDASPQPAPPTPRPPTIWGSAPATTASGRSLRTSRPSQPCLMRLLPSHLVLPYPLPSSLLRCHRLMRRGAGTAG